MIRVEPTETRFVDIHHLDWDLKWSIQFPEVITSMNGVTMTWQKIRPLANANKFAHIKRVNTILGLYVPTLVTPLELLGGIEDER